MKQLLACVVLIALVGFGSFLYRNIMQRPVVSAVLPGACTMEARICPDGSSVGRSGPNCEFAACAAPNVELASAHVAFVMPAGYTANPAALGTDPTLLAVYEKVTAAGAKDSIVVHSFPIVPGTLADDTVFANTMYESSGNKPKSMAEFTPVMRNGRTFQSLTVERTPDQVHSVYYLAREKDVLRFEVIEHGVAHWNDPKLDLRTLPEHKLVLDMLRTVQVY